MQSPLTAQEVIFTAARPLRSCVLLDGHTKDVYGSRVEARSGCPEQQTAYRCNFCGQWHRATKKKRPELLETFHVAWVATRAA